MKAETKLDVLKQIFGDHEITFTFLGNVAMIEMENGLIGEIEVGRSMASLVATVRNKAHGEIANNAFSFEQYLGKDADRSHPNSKHQTVKIWYDRGSYDWYIIRPTSTEPLADAICEYLLMYGRK